MLIKVIHSNSLDPVQYTLEQFEQAMGISYFPELRFAEGKISQKILKRCRRNIKALDPSQKWLGAYYSSDFRRDFSAHWTITWIDEQIGYGVIADVDIPKNAFIGEYTGLVRKRRFRSELDNHYCFDYTIKPGKRTPYIIDAEKQGNYTRFINHSNEPNLETASVLCDGIMHIILYAIKPILKGTQLCYDYGQDYWKKREKPRPIL